MIFKNKKYFFLALINLFCLNIFCQELSGEEAAAQSYVDWSLNAMNAGKLQEAKAALVRASDYASVSSDILYLLALVRMQLNDDSQSIAHDLYLALTTDRFIKFSKNDALLLLARTLVQAKDYQRALEAATRLANNETALELQIKALKGLGNIKEFRARIGEALARYPHNTEFVRILFAYAAAIKNPDPADRKLIDTVLKRLSSLLETDADLAYIAAPFISDTDYARKLITAWRSERQGAVPIESLPVSLKLGAIDESTAIDELFRPDLPASRRIIDKNILTEVYEQLRTNKLEFKKDLLTFSGTLTEGRDGIIETETVYEYGLIESWKSHAYGEATVTFPGGEPAGAEFPFVFDSEKNQSGKVSLLYEKYPSVIEAKLNETTFYFIPMNFFYPVLTFSDLCEPNGLLYPQRNSELAVINENILFANAYIVVTKSKNFDTGLERFELSSGVIQYSSEYVDNKIVSYKNYKNGIPTLEKIDLDLDGRMETTVYYDVREDGSVVAKRIESDWNGDGIGDGIIEN